MIAIRWNRISCLFAACGVGYFVGRSAASPILSSTQYVHSPWRIIVDLGVHTIQTQTMPFNTFACVGWPAGCNGTTVFNHTHHPNLQPHFAGCALYAHMQKRLHSQYYSSGVFGQRSDADAGAYRIVYGYARTPHGNDGGLITISMRALTSSLDDERWPSTATKPMADCAGRPDNYWPCK